MPLQTTQPVEVVTASVASEFRIEEMRFDLSGAQPDVNLRVSAGNTVNGQWQAVKTWWVKVPAGDYAAQVATATGKQVYGGLKQMLYAYLQTVGEFPAGQVS